MGGNLHSHISFRLQVPGKHPSLGLARHRADAKAVRGSHAISTARKHELKIVATLVCDKFSLKAIV